jgi:hypothetical protein
MTTTEPFDILVVTYCTRDGIECYAPYLYRKHVHEVHPGSDLERAILDAQAQRAADTTLPPEVLQGQ